MPTIHYIQPNGTRSTVKAELGMSVMETAIRHNVKGIDAECGGSCSCATCHVYVDPAFAHQLPAPDEMESELLDGVAAERRPESRLSCQLKVSDALDGLLVRIPETQS